MRITRFQPGLIGILLAACLLAARGMPDITGKGTDEDAIIPITFVSVTDPGFTGEMSRYPITNAQYAEYLNAALEAGEVAVDNDHYLVHGQHRPRAQVVGVGGPYAGKPYYGLGGYGFRIRCSDGVFEVDAGFENHPVTYVTGWFSKPSSTSKTPSLQLILNP